MKTPFVSSALLIAAVAVLFAAPVRAKEKDLGGFGVWHALAQEEGGQKTCYMVTSLPLPPVKNTPLKKKSLKDKTGKNKRGQPYIMITHRPIEASLDVFSYGAGAMLDTRRGAILHIGKNSFDLFAVRDTAWARDAQTDHKIAKAVRLLSLQPKATLGMHAYPEMKGGKAFADLFLLAGADAAYNAIGKACSVTVTPASPPPPTKKAHTKPKTPKPAKHVLLPKS